MHKKNQGHANHRDDDGDAGDEDDVDMSDRNASDNGNAAEIPDAANVPVCRCDNWVRRVNAKGPADPPLRCLTGMVKLVGIKPLAHGGFSDVWRGIIDNNAREVAVKVFRAVRMTHKDTLSSRLQIRMYREMKIWHGLNHPGIVPFLGHAELNGSPSLILSWYDNGDLDDYFNGTHSQTAQKSFGRSPKAWLTFTLKRLL
ncbi:hypothetical protein FRB94_002285 [Tulasnella sp. JGI-2019a]|nr:hypothetical protein FRB93_004425 [Tulasnella sp. JGI-2019a]KAG9004544.1 hypothetical protein FRB94_002285 [Tulasnella sp. JGI-2019a]